MEAMESPNEAADDVGHDAALIALAEKLRDVAVRAGRPDVAAKAKEALLILGRADGSADDAGSERPPNDKANAFLRILDGLGF
jgi:hypothetical protein